MTKFIARFEFGANLSPEEAQGWIETVRGHLPEGAIASVKQVPLTINVEDLTDEHKGEDITVYIDKSTGTVHGRLDAVFPAGRHELARTLVIDGVAHTLTYGVAQLSEW